MKYFEPNYNELLLSVRLDEKIYLPTEETIPDFVKTICPCTFSDCGKLRAFDFSENSQLSKIYKMNFYDIIINTFIVIYNETNIKEIMKSYIFLIIFLMILN